MTFRELTKQVSLPWKEKAFRLLPYTFMIIHFQKAATDALRAMTEVLKKESLVGKNYEALLDGARSLVSGLGSVLRVSSYMARAYATSDSNQVSFSLYLRRKRRSFGKSETFIGLKALERPKGGVAKDQLAAKKEVMRL